jgi:predicted outer membrane lipoprotein
MWAFAQVLGIDVSDAFGILLVLCSEQLGSSLSFCYFWVPAAFHLRCSAGPFRCMGSECNLDFLLNSTLPQ